MVATILSFVAEISVISRISQTDPWRVLLIRATISSLENSIRVSVLSIDEAFLKKTQTHRLFLPCPYKCPLPCLSILFSRGVRRELAVFKDSGTGKSA